MSNVTRAIPLKCFREISLSEKTKAIQSGGIALMETETEGLRFFLYAVHDYFVEVTTQISGEVLAIRATDHPGILDLYLHQVNISEVQSGGNPPQ